jgi:hypothetical protein
MSYEVFTFLFFQKAESCESLLMKTVDGCQSVLAFIQFFDIFALSLSIA